MADLVVYTAIFGKIDELRAPKVKVAGCRFVCFTDRRNFKGRGWEIHPPVWVHPTNSRRTARYHKVLAHALFKEAEVSLWVDGCLTPRVDPRVLADRHLKEHDLVMFKHCQRKSVFEELKACIKLKKDNPVTMRKQVNGYKAGGYQGGSLAETTAVLRRHTPKIATFNEAWWAEISRGSLRDQLSVDYVCHKLGIKYGHFPGKRYESPYFSWKAHR
jgi:hypothetical protein